jgi:chromosome segregation ATPase
MELYHLHRPQSSTTTKNATQQKPESEMRTKTAQGEATSSAAEESSIWKEKYERVRSVAEDLAMRYERIKRKVDASQQSERSLKSSDSRTDASAEHKQAIKSNESDALRDKLSRLQAKYDHLKEIYNDKAKDMASKCLSYEDNIKSLKKSLADAKSLASNSPKDSETLRSTTEALERIKQNFRLMKRDFEETQEELQSSNDTIARLTKENAKLQAMNSPGRDSKLENDNDALSKQLKRSSNATAKLSEINKDLQDSKAQLKTAQKKLADHAAQKQELKSVKQEIADERERSAMLKKKSEAAASEAAALKTQLEQQYELESTIQKQRKSIQASQDMLTKAATVVQACSEIYAAPDSQLASALEEVHHSISGFLANSPKI